MKIAIIGAGAAGTTAAWMLQGEHEVVLFEEADRVGGHVWTVPVDVGGDAPIDVELGAQFFFREGYSGLHALLGRFGLTPTPETIALSITLPDGRTSFVVPPLRPRAVPSLLSASVLRWLYWFGRFAWAGEKVVEQGDWGVTTQQLMDRCEVPRDVADDFLVQFVASSWGVPRALARELSAYSVTRVMGVRATRLPHSHRVPGGLSAYVRALVADSPRLDVRLGAPVRAVDREDGAVVVQAGGYPERFDAAILACDWRSSAAVTASSDALGEWHRAFAAFEDYEARCAIHRDPSLMPPDRHHWESANHAFSSGPQPRNTVWSGKPWGLDVFRSWMLEGDPEPRGTSHVARYRHIAMTTKHPARQAAIARLQGDHGIYAAGMYTTGIDNHESALRSAVTVARRLAPEGARARWLASHVSV